jgi:type I restriction enzyme S subunit
MKSGWSTTTLGAVCQIQSGSGFPKKYQGAREGQYPFFKVSDMNLEGNEDALIRANNYVSDSVRSTLGARVFPAGSVLFPKVGGAILTNKKRLAVKPSCADNNIMGLVPNPELIDPGFLSQWMKGLDLYELSNKANPPSITQGNVASWPIVLPPLNEQNRIVTALDQAFAALDRAHAHAEANLKDARILFMSSLRDVFSNHSTAWTSDDLPRVRNDSEAPNGGKTRRSKNHTQTGGREATARPIHGDYSLSVLAPKVRLRPGWTWSTLSSLAKLESGHTPSRRHPEYWGGDIGWISIRDAKDHNGGTIMETREKTNALGISRSSARVLPKDTICLSRTASVGYVVKMGGDMATSQDFVNWICGPELDPDFLMLLLQAQGDDLKNFSSGAVHQTIYFPEVKAFHVCHPGIDVQRKIARSLQAFRREAVKAEDAYVKQLANIAALRQSLLQAGFSGQLT